MAITAPHPISHPATPALRSALTLALTPVCRPPAHPAQPRTVEGRKPHRRRNCMQPKCGGAPHGSRRPQDGLAGLGRNLSLQRARTCCAGLLEHWFVKRIWVSDYPSGFMYPRVTVWGIDFDPDWSSGRVRVLSLGFGFGCPETPPEPTHCHPF